MKLRIKADQRTRLQIANQIIRTIASHGRRFFSQDADRPNPVPGSRVSCFEFSETGRLYYIDKHTGAKLFAHYDPPGSGAGLHNYRFSDGGTLLSLIKNLRDFILKGRAIENHFGPWPNWVCQGDLWGYGADAMKALRQDLAPLLAQVQEMTKNETQPVQ